MDTKSILDQDKVRNFKVHLSLPQKWLQPKDWNHVLLLSQMNSAGSWMGSGKAKLQVALTWGAASMRDGIYGSMTEYILL